MERSWASAFLWDRLTCFLLSSSVMASTEKEAPHYEGIVGQRRGVKEISRGQPQFATSEE